MRLLVVAGPDKADALRRVMSDGGFENVESLPDRGSLLRRCMRFRPHLVIIDLVSADEDSLRFLDTMETALDAQWIPLVLALSEDHRSATHQRVLAAGAQDIINTPAESGELLLRARNLLLTRRLQMDLRQESGRLERRLFTQAQEVDEARLETLARLAQAAEYRDEETVAHPQRVGDLTQAIARRLGLSEEAAGMAGRAAVLHDIGKVAVPDRILHKRGLLDAQETLIMQEHTTTGSHILAGSQSPVLQLAQGIALSHHERWDGTGYPRGLRDEATPLVGRVVAAADAFDAMLHERPYRLALSLDDVRDELLRGRGTRFDPAVIDALEELIDDGQVGNTGVLAGRDTRRERGAG